MGSYMLVNLAGELEIIGKTVGDDVVSESGKFLLRKGTTITDWQIRILKNHGIQSIKVLDELEDPLRLQILNVLKNKEDISSLYFNNVQEIKQLFHRAVSREVPNLQNFMKPFTPLLESILNGNEIFLELHHIKGHDEYTYRHSLNVGLLAATIGRILKYNKKKALLLGEMGFLHDIGKMKVSQNILNKQGPLTDDEFEQVKMHTVYGREMLEQIAPGNKALQAGAALHHERLDRSGYPYGKKGDELPFLTQIIAVADTYDAISSDRVYRSKFSPFHALDELVSEVYKGKLNGEIVFPFVNHILRGYIGKNVLLNDGNKGTIVHLHMEEVNRPLLNVSGEFIDLRKTRDVSISNVLINDS
ncbi:HD-GYP domain-containing protein [Bacillus shivajii]|uniref:HD-GYP domain-containing protein n=1 Tax=Bacillus shivajii TaxID=1983719 RepID=UPI001CF9D6C9|nr:HD-GYP domain-containing protein [Bacillus shivajii]UCZ54434.1 HD-GYP domain-containing protein [Bacillus shivajii]